MHQYILRSGILGSRFVAKDLGPLVGTQSNNQQFTWMEKKDGIQTAQSGSVDCRLEMNLSLCSALVRPHLDIWVQFLVLKCKTDMGLEQRLQQTGMKMIKRLEILFYQEKLRELGLFNLEKGSLRKILSVYINIWRNGVKGSGSFQQKIRLNGIIIDFQRSNNRLLICDFDSKLSLEGLFFSLVWFGVFFAFVYLIDWLIIHLLVWGFFVYCEWLFNSHFSASGDNCSSIWTIEAFKSWDE